jgi:coniferyl-aldehyde dehydrogenase
MDQSLKSPRHSALEDTLYGMFDASRADPAPAYDVRIDRLRRLRALVSDNETRFEQARQNILPRHALEP